MKFLQGEREGGLLQGLLPVASSKWCLFLDCHKIYIYIVGIHYIMFSIKYAMCRIYSFRLQVYIQKNLYALYDLWLIIVWSTFQCCYTTSDMKLLCIVYFSNCNASWYALEMFPMQNGVHNFSFTKTHKITWLHYCLQIVSAFCEINIHNWGMWYNFLYIKFFM